MGEDLVNLHRLRVFIQAAECLSFSRAAERLFLSQPAVSALIRELEKSLGVSLFERKGKLTLTAAGHALYESAHSVVAAVAEAESTVKAVAGSVSGRIDVGVGTMWEHRLPRFLIDFQLRHPQVFLAIRFGLPDDFLQTLVEERLGIIFASRDIQDARLEARRITDYVFSIVALVGSNHPLAGVRALQPQALEQFPFVYYPTRRGGEMIAHLGIKPRYVMEIESLDGITTAVAAGIGISLTSEFSRKLLPTGVHAIRLVAPPMKMALVAFTSKHRRLSVAEQALLGHMRDNAAAIKETLM